MIAHFHRDLQHRAWGVQRERGAGVTTFVFKAETKVRRENWAPSRHTCNLQARGWIPAVLKGVDRENNGERVGHAGTALWELRKHLVSALGRFLNASEGCSLRAEKEGLAGESGSKDQGRTSVGPSDQSPGLQSKGTQTTE